MPACAVPLYDTRVSFVRRYFGQSERGFSSAQTLSGNWTAISSADRPSAFGSLRVIHPPPHSQRSVRPDAHTETVQARSRTRASETTASNGSIAVAHTGDGFFRTPAHYPPSTQPTPCLPRPGNGLGFPMAQGDYSSLRKKASENA